MNKMYRKSYEKFIGSNEFRKLEINENYIILLDILSMCLDFETLDEVESRINKELSSRLEAGYKAGYEAKRTDRK